MRVAVGDDGKEEAFAEGQVVAVAGAAHGHPWLLAAGLVISVALMGLAASLVAKLMSRLPWLTWVGLAIVLYVAVMMIHEGGMQVFHHFQPA